jgi:hypothetical protein
MKRRGGCLLSVGFAVIALAVGFAGGWAAHTPPAPQPDPKVAEQAAQLEACLVRLDELTTDNPFAGTPWAEVYARNH